MMDSLGVVDPIGLPAPVARFLRGVPRTAWLFLGAAVITVVARSATSPGPDLASDVWRLVGGGVTGGLVVALPGIALIQKPTIGTVAPLAYRGLVLIAVGTVLRGLVGAVFGREIDFVGVGGLSIDSAHSAILVGGSLVAAVGWLVLARALGRRSVPASPGLAAVAMLAVVAIAGSLVADLASTATVADGSVPGYAPFAIIGFGARAITGLAWAVLAGTFLRSMSSGESGSGLAAGLWSIAIAIGAGLVIVTSGLFGHALIESNLDLFNAISTAFILLPPILLAVAVALGLLDRADPAR